MDFTFTPEQQALRDSVERFIRRDYGWERRAEVIRSPEGASAAHWALFAELGWLGAGLSEEMGGFGGGAIENAIVMEALGGGLVVEPLIPHIVAANILGQSSSGVAADLLAAMVAGELRVAPAHNEGRREGLLEIDARVEGNRLFGRKTLVEGAGQADLLIVSAKDKDGEIALYLIDSRSPGIEANPYRTLDSHRVSDLHFDGVSVAESARLGFEGTAADALETAIDWGITALCAEAVGAMNAALLLTRDYMLTRKQFGAPLGNFQALQHRMADMLIETEMARSILFQALGQIDDDAPDARQCAVSAAKAQIGAAGVMVGANAIQLHGGIGMTEEYSAGHYYKRLYVIARTMGDVDLHLQRFSRACDRIPAKLEKPAFDIRSEAC